MSTSAGRRTIAAFTVLAGLWLGRAGRAAPPESDSQPTSRIQAPEGFVVELVAAEPLIESPVALDWGPDGRLWVVEMRDYPLGMDNKGRPGGRIVCLEDTDGDGRYDRSTVFLDELLFPTGVMTWRKGILVTCAPEIFSAEDVDGDGRAEQRRVLFTGFGEANPQHRINGMRWGLDNWIYCANGDFAPARSLAPAVPPDPTARGFSPSQAEDLRRLATGGSRVRSLRTGAVHDIRNRDFRFRPDDGLLDPQSGQAQFGRDRDDWGDWFGCNHATPMWHYALDDRYLRRNPHVAAPSPRVEAPRSSTFALGPGRATGTPRSRPGQGNAWTSGCSVMIYRDTLLGPDFARNWLACEPVHNLVHRELLEPAGATFTSRRAAGESAREFLASSDPMFTPVSIRTGPDGALWVVDMHRKVLEHPHWLPPGWEKTVDVRAGHARGRIYRVYPAARRPRPWPRLDRLDAAGLVALLQSPNGWLRDKAQQTLIERRDPSTVALLEAKLTGGGSALARLHALCTLDGLRALRPELVVRALADPHPGVRRQAVRLSETPAARSPEVEAVLVQRLSDADPRVRRQLAYALGEWDGAACARALGRLIRQDASDPHIMAAALSSLTRANLPAVVAAVLGPPTELDATVMLGLLQSAVGFGEPRSVAALLEDLARPRPGRQVGAQVALLAAWLDFLDQRNTPLTDLEKHADEPLRGALGRLGSLFEAARRTVGAPKTPLERRTRAVALLGRGLDRRQEDRAVLAGLLDPRTEGELQAAAAAALGKLDDPHAPRALIGGWKGYPPGLRSRVLEALLQRADGPKAILDALADRRILPQDIPLTARQRLLELAPQEARRRAGALFADPLDPDRGRVVSAYEPATRLTGDPARGRQVFARTCAACHRLGGLGQAVGPDLKMVRDKPPEWFLPALFDPSRAVDARYLSYVAATREGRVFTGVLAEEAGNSITLASPTGERRVILRANLDELASTGKSAMPEGLEKELNHRDVADLIAYLKDPGHE
jgi:putative membrane-bound dehydrogenase-like protein